MAGLTPSSRLGKPARAGLKPSRDCAGGPFGECMLCDPAPFYMTVELPYLGANCDIFGNKSYELTYIQPCIWYLDLSNIHYGASIAIDFRTAFFVHLTINQFFTSASWLGSFTNFDCTEESYSLPVFGVNGCTETSPDNAIIYPGPV